MEKEVDGDVVELRPFDDLLYHRKPIPECALLYCSRNR